MNPGCDYIDPAAVATKDQRIAELELRCGKAALAIVLGDEKEAYHQLYSGIVQDFNLSAEEQASRMNRAMGVTEDQMDGALARPREAQLRVAHADRQEKAE